MILKMGKISCKQGFLVTPVFALPCTDQVAP